MRRPGESWDIRSITEEVRRQLGRLGHGAPLASLSEIWVQAVGAGIAANAWPARLSRDGTLVVSTRSSTWAFELTQLEPELLARLQEHAGESCPTRLRFQLGTVPDPQQHPPQALRSPPRHPAAELLEAAEQLAAQIESAELRAAVTRAIAASLDRPQGASDDRPVW